ncbi:MAG: hypothetical protein R3325_03940 [Thermoanaerobaculia bacterium]|nr:hypothetical protein [Thermoanaerobaculia bacterium]
MTEPPSPTVESSVLAPARRAQARAEVGVTRVSRGTAVALSLAFLATIVAVPLADLGTGPLPPGWMEELGAGFSRGAAAVAEGRPVAANRALLQAAAAAERELEEASLLHRHLLPPVQWVLTAVFGAGSGDAYPGRAGWLFYREDVESLTSPGFLEPRRLEERRRAGDPWRPPPWPDPRPALERLAERLAARGIDLVVMPTPVKPSVHPERLTPRARERPLQNASYPELVATLRERGLEVFDPAPPLVAAAEEGEGEEPLYLATDTHWTPDGLDRVAAALARRLEPLLDGDGDPGAWRRRPVVVTGVGDVAKMLPLPRGAGLYPAQSVEAQLVTDAAGRLWRPDREARVLLLGDSFTNVYSDPALGWGSGAGLAEQLSYHLGRPVDRIAQSAGGAHASREALARDPGRLAGKRVVVYQFASRELVFGDWRPVEWAEGE